MIQVIFANFFYAVATICFFIVFIPQLYLNYKEKRSSGVSIHFIMMWLIADTFSYTGALMNNLDRTFIIITIIHCFLDLLLIYQIIFYNILNSLRHYEDKLTSLYLPFSILSSMTVLSYSTICFFLYFIIPYNLYMGSIFGNLTTLLFLSARIPQFLLSYKKKTTDNLSPYLFVINMTANLSFCISLLLSSNITAAIPWIIGLILSFLSDFVFIYQFYIYRHNSYVPISNI